MEKESQWAERDWQCPSLAQEEGLITLRPHARDFHRIFKKVQRPRAYAREKAGAGLEGCGGARRRPPTEARGSLGPGCVPPGHAVLPTHSKPHPSFSPGTRAATAPRRGSFCSYSIHGSQKSLKKRAEVLYKIDPTLHPGSSLGRLGYAGLGWRALPHFYIEPHRCARAFPCGLWLCGICEACSLLDAQHFLSGPLQKRSAEPGPAWGQRGAWDLGPGMQTQQ